MIWEKIIDLKDKFRSFLFHRKKLRALENYSEVVPFHHRDYLLLIKRCMKDSFLGEKEADFLCYMSDKYFGEQNYLDWTHKTPWLKKEMARLASEQQQPTQVQLDMFGWNAFKNTTPIPVELFAKMKQQQNMVRRV